MGARGLFDPEEIKHVLQASLVVRRKIEFPNSLSHRRRQPMESGSQTLAVQRAEGHAHSFAGHRVDVSTQRGASELVRLAYRRATAHERIENRNPGKIMGRVECLFQVLPRRQQTTQNYPAKNRSQPLRPPLVDVINGPVDLLAQLSRCASDDRNSNGKSSDSIGRADVALLFFTGLFFLVLGLLGRDLGRIAQYDGLARP